VTNAEGDTYASQFQRGLVEGAGALADVPGLALTAKEAAEFAGYSYDEFREGRGGELGEDVVDAGSSAALGAWEGFSANPYESSGALAGSLAGSGVLFKATRGTRLDAPTRYAVQPGEELASAGLSRAAPGIASRFPGGRIDTEEGLYLAAQRAADSDVVRRFLQADRGQADLTGFGGFEVDESDFEVQDFDVDRVDPDAAEAELSGVQSDLEYQAGQEFDATREQFEDFGTENVDESLARRQAAMDRLTFDPDAQTPSASAGPATFDVEAAGDRSVDWTRAAEFEQELADATAAEIDAEFDRLGTQFEISGFDVGGATDPSVETDLFGETFTTEAPDVRVRAESSVFEDQFTAPELETDLFGETDVTPDVRVDTGTETFTEQEFNYEQELASEFEQELEQEFEFEWEGEGERESEWDFGTENDPFGFGGVDAEFDNELFDTGIQDVDDILDS
jgi:hypothetical protein